MTKRYNRSSLVCVRRSRRVRGLKAQYPFCLGIDWHVEMMAKKRASKRMKEELEAEELFYNGFDLFENGVEEDGDEVDDLAMEAAEEDRKEVDVVVDETADDKRPAKRATDLPAPKQLKGRKQELWEKEVELLKKGNLHATIHVMPRRQPRQMSTVPADTPAPRRPPATPKKKTKASCLSSLIVPTQLFADEPPYWAGDVPQVRRQRTSLYRFLAFFMPSSY